jgi:hypothetical protein
LYVFTAVTHQGRGLLEGFRFFSLNSIHPSAWKSNSAKSVYGMLHSSALENRIAFGQELVSRNR